MHVMCTLFSSSVHDVTCSSSTLLLMISINWESNFGSTNFKIKKTFLSQRTSLPTLLNSFPDSDVGVGVVSGVLQNVLC